MKKVVVGMSGGVDSSVAAALLKDMGYQVTGVTMKIWNGEPYAEDISHHGCYGPGELEDIEDARRVAEILGIPLHVFDLIKEYQAEVLDYFSSEYMQGRTPNPCVRCNRKIKFEALIRKIINSRIEFDYFATGHYVRLLYDNQRKRHILKKAIDKWKDQSYFLHSLSQKQLSNSLFPLGNLTKEEVKNTARSIGLGVEDKQESQDFMSGNYSDLIKQAARPGPINDKQGNVIGQHRGIQFYTIGQRKRLGISSKEPLYVTAIETDRNTIIAGPKQELYSDELVASKLSWISIEKPDSPIDVKAKIRYHHSEADARVIPLSSDEVLVKFQEPQMSITPGQAIVFYDGDTVVGGGTISISGINRDN